MKKTLICLIAIAVLTFGAFSNANANEREGRFAAYSGLGFSAGQAVTAFYWQFGGDYWFTDMISINPNLALLAGGGATLFEIVPRARFTFDLPIDYLEAFADAGFGFYVGDATDWIMAFGGGAYYFILDGQLGLGSDLDFTISGATGARFNIHWGVANVMYRF